MHSTSRSTRLIALLAAASLLVSGRPALAEGVPVGDVPAEQDPGRPDEVATLVQPFPVVPGVDLVALGYTGDPIDGAVVARMGEPLPTEPSERVVELIRRQELAPPQLERLHEAEALLGAVVASLDRDLERARAGVRSHTLRAEQATVRLAEERHRLEARSDSLSRQRQDMAEVAVAAYVRPPGSEALSAVIGGAATTSEDLAAGVLFAAKADHDDEVRDSMEVSLALARERVGEADRDVADTAVAVERSVRAVAALESRLEPARAAHAQVADARTLLHDQIPTLGPELDRTIEEAWAGFEVPVVDGAGVPVVDVDGITVHASVAGRLQALLALAHADGVPLGGWGHRNHEQQIALRKAHCGPTPEDVYLKPASACSPPTARPGHSMHEQGLAIDFHLAGASISTRESPGYRWLAANAARFGFHNLPSEPWHWSVNGQ